MVQSRCAFLFILFFFLIIHVLARFRRFRSPKRLNNPSQHPTLPRQRVVLPFSALQVPKRPNDPSQHPTITVHTSPTRHFTAFSDIRAPGRPNIFQCHPIHVLARFRGFRPSDDSNNPRDVFQHHHTSKPRCCRHIRPRQLNNPTQQPTT